MAATGPASAGGDECLDDILPRIDWPGSRSWMWRECKRESPRSVRAAVPTLPRFLMVAHAMQATRSTARRAFELPAPRTVQCGPNTCPAARSAS